MKLTPAACERARVARDRRFDGRFFIGVKTTKIYCRPICPAPRAKSENVTYFESAAAAHEQGFRPCLRCRPEAAPRSPAWRGTEATVARALRMIDAGALDSDSVAGLAARLGIGDRHLRRLFVEHLGTSPVAIAQTRRIHLAKSLLNETDLPMTEIALAAGFGSLRRFNDAMRETYGKPPSALRRQKAVRQTKSRRPLRLCLAFREPYDWDGLLRFFAARAIPGVEIVTGNRYQRTFCIDGTAGTLAVWRQPDASALTVEVECNNQSVLPAVVSRVRRQFDLDCDPEEIQASLKSDPLLATILAVHPGLRLPGAFDGFETTVRGILGQQVTVRGATTIAGRLVDRCRAPDERDGNSGEKAERPLALFPSPTELAHADLGQIGIPGARVRTVQGFAAAVADGALTLDGSADVPATLQTLLQLPGIGPWTASYVAMRVLDDPDAFPSGDLALQKALRPGHRVSARELDERAASWRPWRAYAAALLWRSLNGVSGG